MEDRLKYLFVLTAVILAGSIYVLRNPLSSIHNVSFINSRSQLAQVGGSPQVSPPTNLTASIAKKRIINLSWSPPADVVTSPVAGYVVYRDGKALATTTTTNYIYPPMTLPGVSYCFTVVAFDSNNIYSDSTSPKCISVTVGTAAAPTNLTATIMSSNTVNLTWQYPLSLEQLKLLDPDDSGYDFIFVAERSGDNGASWSFAGLVLSFQYDSSLFASVSSPQITVADTAAPSGSSNIYRVTAFDATGGDNGQGFSVPSGIVNAETPQAQAAPHAPTDLILGTKSFPGSATRVAITFTDNSNDETGWVVERHSGDTWTDFFTYNYSNSSATWDNFFLPILNLDTAYTFRVRAVNSFGRSDPSNTVDVTTPPPLAWTPPVPSQHMLIVYNTNDTRSVDVKNYYLANRPLISGANVLGVSFPARGDTGWLDTQSLGRTIFRNNILTPVTNWIQNHPDIRYVVLMWGMPTASGNYSEGSVGYQISVSLQKMGVRVGVEYKNGQLTRYTPDYYRGTTALVTYIDMGSVESTKAYIDKLKRVYDAMAHKDVILSARDAGLGGSTYYIDGGVGSPIDTGSLVQAENSLASVIYKSTGYFTQAQNVLGYSTGGTHIGLGPHFVTDGTVTFNGKSNWYIMKTGESWNGQRTKSSDMQSNFIEWFSANAFGGTQYENTPVGAVAHVYEPGGPNVNSGYLFSLWERGYLFAEAAWGSRYTSQMIAIGDPLVANTGTTPVATNVLPTVSISSPISAASFTAPATITINANASDSDGTVSKVEFYNGNTLLNSDSSSPYSYTWNNVAVGNYSLTAKAYDNGGLSTISTGVSITVSTVENINEAPTLSTISNKSVNEGESLSFTVSATDPNQDPLTYSVAGLPTGATFVNQVFSFTPTYTQSGIYTVIFGVSDGKGGADSETVTITVNNTNRPPTANAGTDQTITLPATATLTGTGTDPDGQTIYYTWSKVSGAGTVTFSNDSISNPTVTFANSSNAIAYILRLTTYDGIDTTIDDVTITVNPAPIVHHNITTSAGLNGSISPSGLVSVISGNSQNFVITPNSDYQVYQVLVDSTPVVSVPSSGGIYTFSNITSTHTISANFSVIPDIITPTITKFNITPTSSSLLVSITDLIATDNVAVTGYKVTESATAPLSNASGWSPNPPTSHVFTSVGAHTLFAWAKDGAGNVSESMSDTVMITLPNNFPIFSLIGPKNVAEASFLTFTVSAVDIDQDPLTYSVAGLPTGATFVNQVFSFTPTYTQSGIYTVIFGVSDGKGGADSETVTITVNNTNRPPTANAGTDQTITLPATATLTGTGTDPDGQTIYYTWSKVSGAGTVIFADSTLANTTASFGSPGTYSLRLTVSDGVLSATKDMTVVVNVSVPGPSTRFKINDRVQVANTQDFVIVRETAAGTPLGAQGVGTHGTVVGGSAYEFLNDVGYQWWNINYDTGFDGWVMESFLTEEVINNPPVVSLTATPTTVSAPGTVTLSATASSPNTAGSISKVDFYQGSTVIVTDTTSPYSYTWNNVAVGNYSLTAKAYDNGGLTTVSGVVAVTVNTSSSDITPPSISITSPHNIDIITTGQQVDIFADASDSSGVSGVSFLVDGAYIGVSDNTSPYSTLWIATAGSHYLTAVAKDVGNNYATTTITITVANMDTIPPVINIVSPTGTSLASINNTVLSVTTNENAICRYSTMVGTSFADMSNKPFSTTGSMNHLTTLTNLLPGTPYVYYVRCQDAYLNSNQSDYIVIFSTELSSPETDTIAPYVVMSYPLSDVVVPEGLVTIVTSASDSSGIEEVSVYLDNKLIQKDNVSPYTANINIEAGIHSVYAIARDKIGNSATSPSVTFTVQQNNSVTNVVNNTPTRPLTYYAPLTFPQDLPKTEVNSDQSRIKVLSSARITKNLKLNDTGSEVLMLQRTLNLLGYNLATTGTQSLGHEDSHFDEMTKQAVIRYQNNFAESGVKATGFLDNVTQTLINSDISRLISDVESTPNTSKESDGQGLVVSRVVLIMGEALDNVVNLILNWFK